MAVIRGREYTFPPTGDDWDQIDLSNHSTISPAVWRINLTFIVLVGFVVSLRVSTRALMVRQLFLDDSELGPFPQGYDGSADSSIDSLDCLRRSIPDGRFRRGTCGYVMF